MKKNRNEIRFLFDVEQQSCIDTIYILLGCKCWVKSMRRKQVIASNLIPYLAGTVSFFFSISAHHHSHHHHFNQFNKLCVKCYKTINNQTKPNQNMEIQVAIILLKSQPMHVSCCIIRSGIFLYIVRKHCIRFFYHHFVHFFNPIIFFYKKNYVENVILYQNVSMLSENKNRICSTTPYKSIMLIRVYAFAYSNNFIGGFPLWALFFSFDRLKFKWMFLLVIPTVRNTNCSVYYWFFVTENIFIFESHCSNDCNPKISNGKKWKYENAVKN